MGQEAAEFQSRNALAGQQYQLCDRGQIFEKVAGQQPAEISDHEPTDASAYTRYALRPPRVVAREGLGWMFAAGELAMAPSDLARWA
jgi:hypothetical protein